MNDMSHAAPPEGRAPLYHEEAEQAVLGALLSNNEAWDRIGDVLTESDFHVSDHVQIFRALRKLIEANAVADVVTVSHELKNLNALEAVGGFDYLADLESGSMGATNVRRYAEIVRDQALLRRADREVMAAKALIHAPAGKSAREVVDAIQGRMVALSDTVALNGAGFVHINGALTSVMSKLDMLSKNPSDVIGIPTGFAALDKELAGMQPGDLIVLAARPSMGKTALAINIADHVALSFKMPVAVFSMEMSADQVAMRLLAGDSGVNSQRLRVGRLNDKDWDRLGASLARLNDAPIQVDESAALTVSQVRARARKVWREFGGQLGLIVVDYLQLMQADRGGSDNRANDIAEISRGLKALAKELKVPVLALSQLNRSVESRPNKRPVMSDLRESGAVEQDADVILFIYREEYYKPETQDRGIAEIIVAKQRNGPVGTVKLAYRGDNTRFANLVRTNDYGNSRGE